MPNVRVPTPKVYWEDSTEPAQEFRAWYPLFESWIALQTIDRSDSITDVEKNHMLLLMLGSEGTRVFRSNPMFSQASSASFKAFGDAVKDTFSVPVNTVRARYDFFSRRQGPTESCAEYLASLRLLASDCKFCDDSCVKQQIATMLVVGCAHKTCQEKLLMEKEIDFDRFLEVLKTDESARDTASHLRSTDATTSEAYAVKRSHFRAKPKDYQKAKGTGKYSASEQARYIKHCRFCGKGHVFGKPHCPARNAVCDKCALTGHFAAVCQTPVRKQRTSNAIMLHGQAQLRSPQVQNVNGAYKKAFRCKITVLHKGKQIKLASELDTASDITTVPRAFYNQHLRQVKIRPLPGNFKLTGYDNGQQIKGVSGTVPLTLSYGDRTAAVTAYVVPNRFKSLLGKDAIHALLLKGDPATFQVLSTKACKAVPKLFSSYPNLQKSNVGKYPNYEHVIKLAPDAAPKITKLRTVPLTRREAAKKEVQHMVDIGIWEPCDKAEWQHGMVTVPKTDGSVRITTDLTPLDPYVIPSRHPLPNIKELFLKLKEANLFSKLDLTKAYYTIPLAPESRPLTATVTDQGVYQYRALPMGLKDSAAVFQKCVAETLKGISGCVHYIDDILIYGDSRNSHDRNLHSALAALNANNFQLNADKCIIAQPSISFLGHIVSASGVCPSPHRMEAIKDSPPPKDLKGVQRFLGFIRYFQEYIPQLATIAEPLHRLTRKDVPFAWDKKCQGAFKTLVDKLSAKLLVSIFDPNAPTFVSTDASKVGLGASLSQLQNGKEVFITFTSRTLRQHERNYAANEAEELACLYACEYWEKYLLGRHFVLRTDHSALKTLMQKHKDVRSTNKFTRWRERLAPFDFTVEYRKGQDNIVPDTLSRMPLELPRCGYEEAFECSVKSIAMESGITLKRLRVKTAADPLCAEILEYIQTRKWPSKPNLSLALRPYYALRHDFKAIDGLVHRSDERIMVPPDLRKQVLRMAHEGHPGIVRMKCKVKETYWRPGISTDIEAFVKYCEACQRSDKSCPPTRMSKCSLPESKAPWQLISIDLAGRYFNAPHAQGFIGVIMDHYSGFPEYKTFNKITSKSIIDWLESVFSRYGYPAELISDNGPQFTSGEFAKYLEAKGIRHRRIAVYNPQSNAKVERFNKHLKHGIQAFTGGHWNNHLCQLVRSYRATPSASGEKSPAEKLHGWKMRLAYEPAELLPAVPPANGALTRPFRRGHLAMRTKGPFRPGNLVLTRRPPAEVLKGQSPWSTPLKVIRRIGAWTYLLSDGQKWNARRMRRYNVRNPDVSPCTETEALKQEPKTPPSRDEPQGNISGRPGRSPSPRRSAIPVPVASPPAIRRSSRERRQPDRFKP